MTSSLFADSAFTTVVFLVCLFSLLCFGVYLLALKCSYGLPNSGRRSRFELLECRLPLDTQIGTVSMPTTPYTGYLSAAIYDSNGQIVRTLLARSPLQNQVTDVALTWDGNDSLGRPVVKDGTYTWRALVSQVEAADQGGVGDSAFEPTKLTNAGSEVSAVAVDNTISTMGEVGGTFARTLANSHVGDTSIATLSLNSTITGSGRFDVGKMSSGWYSAGKSGLFIGHFSEAAGTNQHEFIGLHVRESTDSMIKVEAYYQSPHLSLSENSGFIEIAPNQVHTFSYTYNPNFESDGSHAGPEGRLTVVIDGTNTLVADLRGATRDFGAQLDAFGMGYTSNLMSENAPTKTARVSIDDVSYTGFTGVQNFNNGSPGWTASNNTTNGNSYGWGPVTSPGGLYTVAYVQEAFDFDGIAADGSQEWVRSIGGNVGVASNGEYVYVSRRVGGQDRVDRYHVRGTPIPFTQVANGYVVVNNDTNYEAGPGQIDYTKEQSRLQYSTWGIAAENNRVWVSNYRNDKVEIFDSNTGVKLGELSGTISGVLFDAPLGIAVESDGATSGTIWVANKGDRVSRFTYTVSGGVYSFTETTSRRISNLQDPSGLSIGGSSNHLFVAETLTGKIREYNISSTPVLAGLGDTFGSIHAGGAITDNQFNFPVWASVAVDKNGILNVNDVSRVQRFYTEDDPGAGISAGDLLESRHSEFGPGPSDTYGYSAGGTHFLLSDQWEYEVAPEYIGGPREGWLGDGSWRLTGRWVYPEGGSATVHRTFMDGQTERKFAYQFMDGGQIVVNALEATGIRRSAILGTYWMGTSRLNTPQSGQYVWTDGNGDGQLQWNSQGSGVDGEVVWYKPLGQSAEVLGKPWVDDDGNIWFTGPNHAIMKLAYDGFDAEGNPRYDWADAVVVVSATIDDYNFIPINVRVADNGDIYAIGTATPHVGEGSLNTGDWIARYNSSGNRLLLAPTLDLTYGAFAIDETDTTPDYYYAGYGDNDQHFVDMFTNDGLLVLKAQPGAASGNTAGWIDFAYGLGVFTHPVTGKTYIYGEDVYVGKSERYRVDNLGTIQRQEGNFEWDAPLVIKGQWKFESNINDSSGSHNGTFNGGTPAYATGQVGNAIDLDGVNDYVEIPYDMTKNAVGSQLEGYTITAWVKPTDVTSVSIITRGDSNPADVHYQLRINSSSKFEHFVWDGGSRTVTGTTTVTTNTWYHVAVTASPGGKMHLYVNGLEEGTWVNVGAFGIFGDRFRIGKDNPDPGQGLGFFDGLLDEVRIYHQVLSSGEISAIQTNLPSVSISAIDPSALEQGQNTGKFLFNRTNTSGNLVVNFTKSGTAANSTDYSSIAGSVTILDGQSSALITVTPIEDGSGESSETVIFTLSTSANYKIGSPGSATVTIADNDGATPTVTVNATDSSAAEQAADVGKFTFTRTNTSGNLVVNFTKSGTATNSSDYSSIAGSVTIVSGQTTATVTVTPIDDPTAESSETVILTISTHASYTVGTPGSATINIADNEPIVTLSATDASAAEQGADVGTFVFTRTNTSGNLVVNFAKSGTATNSSDYSSIAGSVTILNGSSTATVTVTPIDDPTVETSETVILTISSSSSYTIGTPSSDTVTITDNEPTVTISATDANASELGSNTGTFVISRIGSTASALTVNIAYSGTATISGTGDDYNVSPTGTTNITIASGQTTATVTVTPIDDSTAESSETVVLTISTSANYTVGSPNSDTVNIADNEPIVAVTAADASAAEQGLDPGTFVVSRDTTSGSLVVNYTVSGSTATSGSDYSALPGSVTIANLQTSATITVTPINDPTAESTETVILTISSNSNYTIGTPNSATVNIADNDTVISPNGRWTLNSTLADSAGSNNGTFQPSGSPTYTSGKIGDSLQLTAANSKHVEMLYSTDPTAYTITAWVKWTGSGADNIFARGSSGYNDTSHQMRINSSSKFEHYTYDGANKTITGSTTVTTNTWYHVAIVASNSGMARLYVNGVEEGTAVSVGTLWTGGDRFRVGRDQTNQSLGFFDGLVDDVRVYEQVLTGTQIGAIYADVPPTVTISATDATAAELASSTGTFAISRTNTSGDLVVNYTITGTAANGSDYATLPGSVTIISGQSAATITVTPIDDSIAEGNETVILTLASNTNYVVGTPSNATVAITDNVVASINVDFTSNPGWTGVGNTSNGHNFGYSGSTSNAGGATGEAGGTFAKYDNESYYADTNLSQAFNLSNTITASGKVTVYGQVNTNQNWVIGHISSNTTDRSMVGVELLEQDSSSFRFRAKVEQPGGGGSTSSNVVAPNGDYNFEYTYNPSLGSYGRITVRLFNGTFDQTISVDLTSTVRNGGSTFNAFGMGMMNGGAGGTNNPSNTVQMFIDDVSYSGFQKVDVNFSSNPNWTGIGNTSNGHNFGYSSTSNAGGVTGEAGGTFARYDNESYYADTNLSQTFSLSNTIAASGKVTVYGQVNTNQNWVIGHISSSTTDRSMVGIELLEQDSSSFRFRAKVEQPGGGGLTSSNIIMPNGDYNFQYTYDPNLGSYGRVTVRLFNGTYDQTVTVDLDSTVRNGGSTFNAFGIGMMNGGGGGTNNASETVQMFIDDVSYSGFQKVDVNFSSNPGWTGSGNTSNGHNFGYSSGTNNAGGITGEAGGTFARYDSESYYADTNLSQTFNLANTINASGKVTVYGQVNTNQNWVIGHISSSTSDRSMVGIEFLEQDSSSFRFRARVDQPSAAGLNSGNVIAPNGDYNFEYTYDPSIGSYGRVTVRLFNGTYDQTASIDLNSTVRNSGSTFNAFGIGMMNGGGGGTNNSSQTVQMFIDDVSYAGFVRASDGFESGNGTGGTGWAGAWTLGGAASVVNTGTPMTGSYHLQLTGNNGTATRAVDLTGTSNARLIFDWKANSFESGETAVVEIYNGSSWITVQTISDGQDDNVYHHSDIDLSGYTLGSSFQVRIRSLMSATDDTLYIDNLKIAR